MKVYELIEYLKIQDLNGIVGRFDIGQDSAEWYEITKDELVFK